jgi:hypothetical protein
MSANLRHCAENADLAIPHFIQVVSSICFVGIVESQITGIALGKIAFVFKTRYSHILHQYTETDKNSLKTYA